MLKHFDTDAVQQQYRDLAPPGVEAMLRGQNPEIHIRFADFVTKCLLWELRDTPNVVIKLPAMPRSPVVVPIEQAQSPAPLQLREHLESLATNYYVFDYDVKQDVEELQKCIRASILDLQYAVETIAARLAKQDKRLEVDAAMQLRQEGFYLGAYAEAELYSLTTLTTVG